MLIICNQPFDSTANIIVFVFKPMNVRAQHTTKLRFPGRNGTK